LKVFIKPKLNQTVIIIEIIVKKIAIKPIILDFSEFCFKYFTAGQSPKGGRRRLKR